MENWAVLFVVLGQLPRGIRARHQPLSPVFRFEFAQVPPHLECSSTRTLCLCLCVYAVHCVGQRWCFSLCRCAFVWGTR